MPNAKEPEAPEPEVRFDQLLTQLQSVVEKLEAGKLSLEESLAAFEEGAGLARRGQKILDAAERKIEILVKGESGEVTTAPFPDTETE